MIASEAGVQEREEMYFPYRGERWTSGSDPNHYKFTGKERDTETGLDYFGARYFSSTISRFMSPDWAPNATAVPYANYGNPQSLNLYGYVRNNPTTTADPDGHNPYNDFDYGGLCGPQGDFCGDGGKNQVSHPRSKSELIVRKKKPTITQKKFKKMFYKKYGKALNNAIKVALGPDAKLVPKQTAKNSPDLVMSKSSHQIAAENPIAARGADQMAGINIPTQGEIGTVVVASVYFESGEAGLEQAFRTYAHEVGNVVDARLNPHGKGGKAYEESYGDKEQWPGDGDTGQRIEGIIFDHGH